MMSGVRRDADSKILAIGHSLILNRDRSAFSDLSVDLGVLVHHKVHLAFALPVYFEAEGMSAVSDRSNFAGDGLGRLLLLLVARVLRVCASDRRADAEGHQSCQRCADKKFTNHWFHTSLCVGGFGELRHVRFPSANRNVP